MFYRSGEGEHFTYWNGIDYCKTIAPGKDTTVTNCVTSSYYFLIIPDQSTKC